MFDGCSHRTFPVTLLGTNCRGDVNDTNVMFDAVIIDPLQRIDEVTLDEVNAVARQVLTKPFGAAVLGPYKSKRSLPQQLRTIRS